MCLHMSFLFASPHLPETRVQRPDELEDEEDDVQPMLHSGGVRAFSHLPAKRAAADPAGPLSQRGAQALGRQFQRTEPEGPATPHEDGISAAKASGVFDAVRQQFNRDDSPHFMDEDGNLRPRDETRQQDTPSPRDPGGPQFGAGAPTRPAWSTAHAAAPDSSRSPRTPPPASDDTRPWYMPPITPEDLGPLHHDDDDDAGSHSAPKGRPEVHDLVYRTPGASTPKPGLQDLVYRFNGSQEEAKDHRRDYLQNVADAHGASPQMAASAEVTAPSPAISGEQEGPHSGKASPSTTIRIGNHPSAYGDDDAMGNDDWNKEFRTTYGTLAVDAARKSGVPARLLAALSANEMAAGNWTAFHAFADRNTLATKSAGPLQIALKTALKYKLVPIENEFYGASQADRWTALHDPDVRHGQPSPSSGLTPGQRLSYYQDNPYPNNPGGTKIVHDYLDNPTTGFDAGAKLLKIYLQRLVDDRKSGAYLK